MIPSDVVTVDDFVLALEEEEVVELSHLYDPNQNLVDNPKIQYALDRAICVVNSYFVVSPTCGKALMLIQAKNLVVWIARWLLDTVKARPQVQRDMEHAYELLREYKMFKGTCPIPTQELMDLGLPVEPKNGLRFASDGRRWTDKETGQFRRGRLLDYGWRTPDSDQDIDLV